MLVLDNKTFKSKIVNYLDILLEKKWFWTYN